MLVFDKKHLKTESGCLPSLPAPEISVAGYFRYTGSAADFLQPPLFYVI